MSIQAVGAQAQSPSSLFKILADETRTSILRLLALTDLRGGEIVERLSLPHNAVTYHLKQMSALGLLRDRRSHADGRDIYYSLDVDRLSSLYHQAGLALHPSLAPITDGAEGTTSAGGPPLRVLFLCTHNSARSQLAEAALRRRGGEQVEVYSAGSRPTAVDPMAVALLEEHDIDPRAHTVKSLDRFAGASFDYVITVCDRMREDCPDFPGDPLRIHWSFPDPTELKDAGQRRDTFRTLWLELNIRVGHLLNLPHPATGRRPGGVALGAMD
jgi:protein-tyrosine-phosphatase